MKTIPSRRGSALLIVLGMLAFLIVSAVGFSAYMRYSRMPSSYLRRTSSSRLLVKAAAARAIDEIDRAVCNNPHPGIGTKWVGSDRESNGEELSRTANIWRNRVLMETNNWQSIEFSDTVPVLSMEALAYIPAPLVNSARYFGRRSPAAIWKTFGFDSGRYAFTALDVSDYFDVNRMFANVPRSSASNSRISLAYIFETTHKSAMENNWELWDKYMENYRVVDQNTHEISYDGKFPFISLADFNLAVGAAGSVGIVSSPFYKFVAGSGGVGFYGTSSKTEEDYINRMTFVTDGLFPVPQTAQNSETMELADSENQPFEFTVLDTLNGSRPTLSGALMGMYLNSKGRDEWRDRLGYLGCLQLFDYLDTDHVPVSVAVPTLERTPMICGIEPQMTGSSFKLRKETGDLTGVNGGPLVEDGDTRQVECTVRYKVDGSSLVPGFVGGEVKTIAAFPFSHEDKSDSDSFTVDGRFSMFLSSADMPLRTGNVNDSIHLTEKTISESAFNAQTGLLNVKLPDTAIGRFQNVVENEDAVKEISGLRLSDGQRMASYFAADGNELIRVKYVWTQTREKSYGPTTTANWAPSKDTVISSGDAGCISSVESNFKVVDANGTASDSFCQTVKSGGSVHVWLNAAVWLRVKDGQDVVDMVPACILDDKTQNDVNDASQIYQGLSGRLGTAYPLFKFSTGVEFDLSLTELDKLSDQGQDIVLSPKAAMIEDPRYNYAPEHWHRVDASITKEDWINSNVFAGRDGDVFMATSDSGYLQSKYELAFLPRIGKLKNYGTDKTICDLACPSSSNLTEIPEAANAVNRGFAFRTYDPFGDDENAFDDLPWTNEGSGFKVNPWTDSTNMLMSVFANTPIDWKRASTNRVSGVEEYVRLTAKKFNTEYAFNEYSKYKLAWKDLEMIARRFKENIANQSDTEKNWEDAWQDMDWYYDKDKFCGVTLSGDTDNLTSADRKFLYGFWRDCFAVKQQLYLVFVRAEPAMMGGEGNGQTPPQLGARAVALVWRDPKPSSDPKYPHQTRILFYRQFD